MSNNRGLGGSSADQSALSLLVNAADSRDPPRGQRGDGGGGVRGLPDALRLRGLGGGAGAGDHGLSFEEQLLLQQHQQGGGAFGSSAGSQGLLLSQLRDQSLLSQLGQQQQLQQLLLGGLGGSSQGTDVRSALAAAQMRASQPQLTHADLLALSRTGALSGLSSILGQGGGGGGGGGGLGGGLGGASSHHVGAPGLASELEGLQRLEELERRQRLMTANANAPLSSAAAMGRGGGGAGASSHDAPEPATTQSMSRSEAAAAAASSSGLHGVSAPRSSADAPSVTALSMSSSSRIKNSSKPKESAPASSADGNKDELEKAPGSVIVPCRARGMPMDHNFKTAYFVIPENVKHGEELICSYFACRNAGIKFRYCSHCKVPVAKRNFRKRHKHGGEDVDKLAGEDSGGEDEICLPVGKGIPSQVIARSEESVDADCISSQSADSATHQQEKNVVVPEVSIPKNLVSSSMHTFEANKKNSSSKIDDSGAGSGAVTTSTAAAVAVSAATAAGSGSGADAGGGGGRISDGRRQRWASLLAKRPSTKDGDSMSVWLMEVLAVSDLETPLKADELPQPSSSEAGASGGGSGKKDGGGGGRQSPRSDAGYEGSSNEGSNDDNDDDDDDNNNNNKDKTAEKQAAAAAVAAAAATTSSSGPSSSSNGIVKKKRSADIFKNSNGDAVASGGSFAEWMERKKQKKQSKLGAIGSSTSSQPTAQEQV